MEAELELTVICPGCNKGFTVFGDSGTGDCPHCNLLVLIENDKIYDFHKKLHEEDPRWPADGKGTGYIEIK
jgi:hypothetical protein